MPVFLFSEVVSVGAVKKSFRVAPYSSNGQELDVVAPGNEILRRTDNTPLLTSRSQLSESNRPIRCPLPTDVDMGYGALPVSLVRLSVLFLSDPWLMFVCSQAAGGRKSAIQ